MVLQLRWDGYGAQQPFTILRWATVNVSKTVRFHIKDMESLE
jgi:hypothetical protein